MTDTRIPGYLGTVTINSENLSAVGRVRGMDFSRVGTIKRPFGQAWTGVVAGQETGMFMADGKVGAEKAAALNAAYASRTPIECILQIGESGGATDGGNYVGNFLVVRLGITAAVDGVWEWTMQAISNGAVAYNAPA